jgi:GT2 family glycosyltransferase
MTRAFRYAAGFRVLQRHLRYAGINPRKLASIARRTVQLVRSGALAGVLERHAREEEQYADYGEWCARYDADPRGFASRVGALPRRPLVSILMPVFDPTPGHLVAALESVRLQAYPDWELCIVDDASTNTAIASELASAAARDARIRITRRAKNGGIAVATNDALATARGEYCAFLDHDDTLAPDALLAMMEAAALMPDVALMFSDEDKLDPSGRRTAPFFKPAWDDEWIRTTNCVLHLTVVRTDLLRQLGGIATAVDGAQDWDLVLRVREKAGPSRIAHVPRVLYHWRQGKGSTAAAAFEKPALLQAQADVIARSLARRADAADPVVTERGWRIAYRLPSPPPLVSVVIPSRDRADLLRACITSLRERTAYPALDIIVVDNDSRNADALAYLRQLESGGSARVIQFPHAFNYAAQCNLGVREARGSMIALVNNDVEAIGDGWLQELVSLASRERIGLAGATLFYPDGTLQHAGVVLGLNGVGDRPWIGTPRGFAGPYHRANAVREVSAMITACAAVARDRYLEVGGMNEELAVSCNDLDLCLRLRRAGYRHVITPYAELVHKESASRGYDDDPVSARRAADEERRFSDVWRDELVDDPLYNPNLALHGRAYALARPPRTNIRLRSDGAIAIGSELVP